MLRWILTFGLRREQPKTCRSMDTVKPNLEELTQRILLSASGTTSPQMTAQMTAMMDQTFQLIETIELNLVNIFDTYTQRIAQDVASNVQQWQQLLGLTPPASGSGSGSGSGTITPTHNPSNQQPQPAAPKSGSGTGSGAITSHENPSKSGGKSMMGSGSCGSGSGSGSIPYAYFGSGSNPYPEEALMCGPVTANRTVLLSGPTCHTVKVDYETVDGTATAGTDYTYTSGTVTFAPGQVAQTLPNKIPILDDGDDESVGTEFFYVKLTGAQGATVGEADESEVVITEDPQQKPTDTLRWVPCNGNNASTVTNWVDIPQQGAPFRLQKRSQGPNPLSPIQFDAKATDNPNSNKPITWDTNETVASISLIQYTGQQTINPGVKVESNGANGTALSMDGSSSDLELVFGDGNSKYQIDNNGTITNMLLKGDSYGQFIVAGGTTKMAQSTTYTESLGVQFTINKGATVNDQGYTSIQLTADNLTITVYGEMDFFYGVNNGISLISGGANYPDDFIWVYGGFLGYYGSQNVTDTITIPIAVQNGGTFKVSASAGSTGGKLVVQGDYHDPDFEDSSVYMEADGSSVQLAYGDTLECDGGYKQVSGTLATTDASTCTLKIGAGGNGTATIAGGYVWIDIPNSGYGSLDVDAATMNFYGSLLDAIDASNQANCDVLGLGVNCVINLKDGSALEVKVNNGTPAPGLQWAIIKGLLGGPQGDFSSIAVIPSTIKLTGMDNPKDPAEYIVKS